MDASHLMRKQKSSLPLPFSIIATDIGAGHTEKENEKTCPQELQSGPGARRFSDTLAFIPR